MRRKTTLLLYLFLQTIGIYFIYTKMVEQAHVITDFQVTSNIKSERHLTFESGIKFANFNLNQTTTFSRTVSISDTLTHANTNHSVTSKGQHSNPMPSLHAIHNLSNVMIRVGKTAHHIYSAYYDSRKTAIVMLGYVENRAMQNIICKFIYEDSSTKCGGLLVHYPIISANVMPEFYLCKMSSHDEIPTYVAFTKSGKCQSSNWSTPIPVWNRGNATKDGVGVCVHGALFVDSTRQSMFCSIVEFLAMVKVLGVKIVTLYNLNEKHSMLKKVLKLYPEFVDMVQWENLTGILHYHGQRVLLNDCLYRNMNRVKYLAFIDLDEMIFPVSTNNWMDMLEILEEKGNYASFSFSNNFIAEVPADISITMTNYSCSYMGLPKYFVRLQRLPWPPEKQNTKMKMIVKPETIFGLCIHDVCHSPIRGYNKTFRVPHSVGFMAHYRVPVPKGFIYGRGVEDKTALKYKDRVMKDMRRVCLLADV